MNATIITIGDEILIGQITDTNSGFIAKALNKIGVEVHEMISISDDKTHILETFTKVQNLVDFVIITGGLGPTKDDLTKYTLASYVDSPLEIHEATLTQIEGFFVSRNKPMLEVNVQQAALPTKATILKNRLGTAAGMWLVVSNFLFCTPIPPGPRQAPPPGMPLRPPKPSWKLLPSRSIPMINSCRITVRPLRRVC